MSIKLSFLFIFVGEDIISPFCGVSYCVIGCS